MSGTPTQPTSPHHEQEPRSIIATRAIAIIKNHALKHRLTIERHILEAGFEIVKERQMEFDPGSDQDFLHELFGRDTPSLFEGPVWVYVLERRRAPEVLKTLMGDEDPVRARATAPNSLRAIYGTSLAENAFVGSPDAATAEEQIACLFASSPPFPPAELPIDEQEEYDEVERELGRFVLDGRSLDDEHAPLSWTGSDNIQSPSSSVPTHSISHHGSGSSSSTAGSLRGRTAKLATTATGKTPFKARPVPATNLAPSIQPRTTRAAALRAGQPVAPTRTFPSGPRIAPTKAELARTFMDVPGHKRSSTIQVASTAPPEFAPRMTRAASLRQGKPAEPARVRPSLSTNGNGNSFEGVPGHKRRESIAVASVKAPSVAPRLNKSAALRAQKDAPPPSSFMFRTASTPRTPGTLSRTPSQSSLSPSRPQSTRPPSSQATIAPKTPAPRRPASVSRTASQTSVSNENGINAPAATPAQARAPSIAPRLNRSAMLRANMGVPPSPPAKKPAAKPRPSIVSRNASRTVVV